MDCPDMHNDRSRWLGLCLFSTIETTSFRIQSLGPRLTGNEYKTTEWAVSHERGGSE